MTQTYRRIQPLLVSLALLGLGLSLFACAPAPRPAPAAGVTSPTPAPISSEILPVPERTMRFEQISLAEGLSESVVNDTLQDRQGFIWFATEDGLNRFDGYQFTVYKHDPNDPYSLSHNHVTRLLEDRQGRIWIGTFNAGLNRLDPATGQFTRYRSDDQRPDAMQGNRVNAILEDRDGAIWVGTSRGGLNRYDPQADGFQHYQNDPADPSSLMYSTVLSLYETQDGVLWVGTSKGLDQLDRATGKFTHYPVAATGSDGPLAAVTSLQEDQPGRLWVGTQSGLDRLDRATGKFVHYRPNPAQPGALAGSVLTLFRERSGVLWIGTRAGGLCRLAGDANSFTCYRHDPTDSASLSTDDVQDIYEDRAGILWIGTFGGGANKLEPGYKPFVHIHSLPQNPDSLAGDLVFGLLKDAKGDLWVGMQGAGLDRIDGVTGKVTHFRHDSTDPGSLKSDRVHTLYQDRSGALWVGTEEGLSRFDAQTGKFLHYKYGSKDTSDLSGSFVNGIAEDAQGNLWITTDGGLNCLDGKTGKFSYYLAQPGVANSLAENSTTTLFIDGQDQLWIGTQTRGLEHFDPHTKTFTHFPSNPDDPRSLSDPYVLDIYRDSRGIIWVGTMSGLNRLELTPDGQSGSFRHYQMKDGLPNDFIYAIQEDARGGLWLSTNKGLSRFDPVNGTFHNFDVKDGLQSNEFNQAAAYAAADGEMFFGGIHGVTAFYPDAIRQNPYVPPVVLTSLTQGGERIETGLNQPGEITVRWPDNSLDFDFAALNYTRPENNQYAYMLEKFDRDWINLGSQHSGRYTNLPGGSYTLRLKGSNNDGVWNEAGIAIPVRVIPPLWETWWFQGLAVLCLAGLVFGGVRLRIHGMESRNQALERLVRARTAEIEQLYEQNKELAVVEERNRLARDLHDSAKQKAFAALAQLGAANGLVRSDPPRAYPVLREAETLVYEVIEELTFLIQEMYPVALKEKGLPTVLREYIFEWESRTEIWVNFTIENERTLPLKVEQACYRIVQEALANVARHSQARRVTVTMRYQPEQVQIVIADDGRGFDIHQRPAGVGLRSMQERIAMIGGQLTIQSQPDAGTRITACAPVQVAEDEARPLRS